MTGTVVPELIKPNESLLRNVVFSSPIKQRESNPVRIGNMNCTLSGHVVNDDQDLPFDNFGIEITKRDIDWMNSHIGCQNLYTFTRKSGIPSDIIPPDDSPSCTK